MKNFIILHTRKSGLVTVQSFIGKIKITRYYVGVSKPVALARFRTALDLIKSKPAFQRS